MMEVTKQRAMGLRVMTFGSHAQSHRAIGIAIDADEEV